jgi:pimeloyl-ACP methyl ester carboxylesterase
VTAAAGTDAAGVPVVLVHGFASSAEHNWRRTGWLDLLADEGREAIAVDLPGHGLGPHPASSAGSPEEIVAAAIGDHELVDAIGFSAGARVLLRAAAAQPQRFRRMVLIGVGPGVLAPADPGLSPRWTASPTWKTCEAWFSGGWPRTRATTGPR